MKKTLNARLDPLRGNGERDWEIVPCNSQTRLKRMPPKISLILNPEQLQAFKEVDKRLPELIIQLADRDAKRDFWYALAGMGTSALLFLSVVGAFVYLIMQGHEKAAAGLLVGGVLGIINALIRARLRSTDKSKSR